MIDAIKRMSRTTVAFLTVVALVVLTAVGFGIYGLIKGPPEPAPAARPPATAPTAPSTTTPAPAPVTPPAAEPTPGASTGAMDEDVDFHGEGLAPAEEYAGETLPDIEPSPDPITYARRLTAAMFDWSTTDGLMPLDYIQRVMRDADPSGEEAAGLREDLQRYLPRDETWKELQPYGTSQRFEITKAYIPAQWEDAKKQDTAGRIKAGTIAVTIDGFAHRKGLVDGEIDTFQQGLEFTVFLICQPAYPTCHPLRLSYWNDTLR